MLNRRNVLSGAAAATAALVAPEKSAAFLPPPITANHMVTWSNVVINGGGTLPGFSFSNDGTILCRTDISGAYKWDGSKWNQILTQNHLPYPSFGGYVAIYGVPDIQIAPSDSSRIYVLLQDGHANEQAIGGGTYIYRSKDGGASFSMTTYPNGVLSSVPSVVDTKSDAILRGDTDIYKRIQNKLAVDPANPDVVYATNPGGHPVVTTDGGATWSNVSNLPPSATVAAYGKSSVGGSTASRNGNYTVTLVGGTFTTAAQFTATIAGGAIVGIGRVVAPGAYTVVPPNPVSVTGAGLTGAKINVTFQTNDIGAICWQFDASRGTTVVNGKTVTKYIYTSIYGNGVWQSTDGGVSFSKVATFPSSVSLPQYCSMSADGVYYVTYCGAASTYNFYLGSYNGGTSTWTADLGGLSTSIGATGTPRGGSAMNIAAHPTTAGIVIGFRSSGNYPNIDYSTNHGASWTGYNYSTESFLSSDAVWYRNQIQVSAWSGGMCVFNPAVSNELWYCLGQGLVKSTLSGAPFALSWTTVTAGIENAVCNDLIHESGTALLQVMADLVGFVRPTNSLSTAPTNSINPGVAGGFGPVGGNSSGWAGAIDPYNKNYMVLAGNQNAGGAKFCGYSQDGGTTWAYFPTSPGDGTITAVIPGNILISNGVILWMAYLGWYRSTDWGTTWTAVGVPAGLNIPTTGDTGWGGSYGSIPSHTGCIDRVNSNKFYIHNNLYRPGPTPPLCKGTYISTDAGQNFTYQGANSDPFIRTSGIVLNEMKCVPGHEGYLFAATGYVSTGGAPHPQTQATFMKSTDGGASWTAIPNMFEVCFGFGKAGPSGNPTLFVSGFYKNNYGIFMSEDLGVTFGQLTSTAYGTWPITNDAVQCMEGDKNVFGRCYIGFRGSGTVYSTLLS